MSTDDLAHLDWLARMDALRRQVADWAAQPVDWEPLRPAQALLERLLARLEPLRIRWEAPLVVATFGGTGTGKSSLVNALVGEEVSKAGKERPTTLRPILLAHPATDLSACQIPLDRVEVVHSDLPLLRDIVLLDCPDPDTTETEADATNLRRLHELLPYCDVLIYVSTQQKYRSAKVGEELGKAAESCRLVFVQTHADTDSDIRDDWRAQLEPHYRIAEMFFVDSRQAFAEQRQGIHATGDFGRLRTFLSRELAASRRAGIRKANLLEQLDQGLSRSIGLVRPFAPKLAELDNAISKERLRIGEAMAERFTAELAECRGLWERRLLAQVTQMWGFSPFSGLLRLYQAQAALLASWSLFRARSTAQLALWGAWQGARWFGQRQSAQAAEERIGQIAELGLDPALFRTAHVALSGYVHAAQLRKDPNSGDSWQQQATAAGAAFVAEATQKLNGLIERAAVRNTGWFTRFAYELLFLIFPAFLLYRIGRNYFYDSFWLDKPLLDLGFYLPSLIFLFLWCALFIWRFLSRLRRGVQNELRQLANSLSDTTAWDALFGDVAARSQHARDQFAQLEWLQSSVATLRQSLEDDSRLGGRHSGPLALPRSQGNW
jgi:hypothetical protein